MIKIYEVIRVIDRQPIFLVEHLHRMQQSLAHYPAEHQLDLPYLKQQVETLARQHETGNFNVRIEYDLEQASYGFYAVAGVYPTPEMYRDGVVLVTFPHQRHDPNVKVYDASLRDAMDEKKAQYQAFDLLYIHDGVTSEASKSNIFFIKNNQLYTSPDEAVLKGITRMKALESADDLGIVVHKRPIMVDELADFEGAFLSGTSLHLLPINRVDQHRYRPDHPVWQALNEQFDKKIVQEVDRQDL